MVVVTVALGYPQQIVIQIDHHSLNTNINNYFHSPIIFFHTLAMLWQIVVPKTVKQTSTRPLVLPPGAPGAPEIWTRHLHSSIRLVASPRSDFTWFPGYAWEPSRDCDGMVLPCLNGGFFTWFNQVKKRVIQPRKMMKHGDFTIKSPWTCGFGTTKIGFHTYKSRTFDPDQVQHQSIVINAIPLR